MSALKDVLGDYPFSVTSAMYREKAAIQAGALRDKHEQYAELGIMPDSEEVNADITALCDLVLAVAAQE